MNLSPTSQIIQPELRTKSDSSSPQLNQTSVGLNKISIRKHKVAADDVFEHMFGCKLNVNEKTGLFNQPAQEPD